MLVIYLYHSIKINCGIYKVTIIVYLFIKVGGGGRIEYQIIAFIWFCN